MKTATIRLCDLKFLARMAKKAVEDEAVGTCEESQAATEHKEKLYKLRLMRIRRIQIHAKIGESDPFAGVRRESRVL